MRISDWSSDVCSSDLGDRDQRGRIVLHARAPSDDRGHPHREADGALTAIISEDQLREKLLKIEALYAGAKTDGEKSAAGAAAERIRVKFENASKQERAEEFKFSITDPWSRQLFIALCRRYGIKPFRYTRMHRQTVIIR